MPVELDPSAAAAGDGTAAIEAGLARERAALEDNLAELRARLMPGNLASEVFDQIKASDAVHQASRLAQQQAKSLYEGAASMAQPVAQMASSGIKANPVATALAGAGLAWLGYSALKQRKAAPEALPSWLQEAAALQQRAALLQGRIASALADGAFDAAEAAESRADVTQAFERELGLVLGQGLDVLDAETRAAALAGRRELFDKKYGKGAKTGLGTWLSYAAMLASAGGTLAAVLPRGDSAHAARGADTGSLVAGLMAKARQIFDAELAKAVAVPPEAMQATEASGLRDADMGAGLVVDPGISDPNVNISPTAQNQTTHRKG